MEPKTWAQTCHPEHQCCPQGPSRLWLKHRILSPGSHVCDSPLRGPAGESHPVCCACQRSGADGHGQKKGLLRSAQRRTHFQVLSAYCIPTWIAPFQFLPSASEELFWFPLMPMSTCYMPVCMKIVNQNGLHPVEMLNLFPAPIKVASLSLSLLCECLVPFLFISRCPCISLY